MATFDEFGRQVPDPRPVEMPTGLRVAPTLQEEIKRYIRAEMSLRARDAGHETWEEANDFTLEDAELDDYLEETAYTLKELLPEVGDRDASESPKGPSITPSAPPGDGSQPASK